LIRRFPVSTSLSFEVALNSSFSEAVEHVIAALKQEGFGVLTRIEIHDAFKEKLGVDFRRYTILGACNPPLAHRALSAAPEAGLLLPCNVTVEEREGGGALVRIVNPEEMMKAGGFSDDETVSTVGREAYDRLRRVADALSA
jgi:uncharacterized protein (DUF302 family)